MVHAERFDMSKYMSNRRVIEFLHELRGDTLPVYNHSYTGEAKAGSRKE
jgi:hypothetical protein